MSENIVVHSFLQVFCKFSTGFLLGSLGDVVGMPQQQRHVWYVLAWMVDGWRLRLMKTCKKLDTSKLVKNWTWRFGKLVKNSQFSTGFLILDRPRKTGKKLNEN